MSVRKLRVNFCDTVDFLSLPGVSKNMAKQIAQIRDVHGNITANHLGLVPNLKKRKGLMKRVDFTPNPLYRSENLEKLLNR